ncbi:MAG: hypothetical protein QNJ45_24495 [Ardenticatenaceae bacterium]|nr:hypothetical protein [Ardenticatenaceae bacterium]
MTADFSEYLSAGFVITRQFDRPAHLSSRLLPDQMISTSGCLASFLPDTWCIEWAQDDPDGRLANAQTFGLDGTALDRLTTWATAEFDRSLGWPNIILNFETVRHIVDAFLPAKANVRILELGLHQTLQETFIEAAAPQHAMAGQPGVLRALQQANNRLTGGRPIGFEPLVFDVALSCSWLCNGLESTVAERLGITPNEHGLIESFEDGLRCVDYISRDDVGAEPGLWLPWLLVDHSGKFAFTA